MTGDGEMIHYITSDVTIPTVPPLKTAFQSRTIEKKTQPGAQPSKKYMGFLKQKAFLYVKLSHIEFVRFL